MRRDTSTPDGRGNGVQGCKALGLALVLLAAASVPMAYAFEIMGHQVTNAPGGQWKERAKPNVYGNVVLKARAEAKGEAAVVFPHWLHRSKYTCRLCHVDIGFAMAAGETGVSCDNIKEGIYCGACHDGKESFSRDGTTKGRRNCDFCHSVGRDVEFKNDFYAFRAKFKPDRFGNGIDWLAAEKYKRIVLKDFLPNVSIKREAFRPPTDLTMFSEDMMVPGIIFSHEKHIAWNGCELCHPEIFGVKMGSDQFDMHDVQEGKYCGVCHGSVAFPLYDCRRCHKNVVF